VCAGPDVCHPPPPRPTCILERVVSLLCVSTYVADVQKKLTKIQINTYNVADLTQQIQDQVALSPSPHAHTRTHLSSVCPFAAT
jgi:hypothetical protein